MDPIGQCTLLSVRVEPFSVGVKAGVVTAPRCMDAHHPLFRLPLGLLDTLGRPSGCVGVPAAHLFLCAQKKTKNKNRQVSVFSFGFGVKMTVLSFCFSNASVAFLALERMVYNTHPQ